MNGLQIAIENVYDSETSFYQSNGNNYEKQCRKSGQGEEFELLFLDCLCRNLIDLSDKQIEVRKIGNIARDIRLAILDRRKIGENKFRYSHCNTIELQLYKSNAPF